MSNDVFTVGGHVVKFDNQVAYVDGLFQMNYHQKSPGTTDAKLIVDMYEDWVGVWDFLQELPEEDNPNIVPGKYKEVVKLFITEDHLGDYEEEGNEAS